MLEKIADVIKTHTGNKDLVISEKSMFLTDLGLNSFDYVQIICKMEKAFDVEIPDEEIENIKTVGDLIGFIESQK